MVDSPKVLAAPQAAEGIVQAELAAEPAGDEQELPVAQGTNPNPAD